MNPSIFAATYIVLRVTHGIADYWLQPGAWAEAKSKKASALLKHVVTYTACFIPALLFFQAEWVPTLTYVQMAWVLLAIALPHAVSDTYAPIVLWLEKLRGWPWDQWTAETFGKLGKTAHFIRLHVLLAFDQEFHKASLAAVAAYLAS